MISNHGKLLRFKISETDIKNHQVSTVLQFSALCAYSLDIAEKR